jgi:ParB family transcriptional regulator, chromosome partitioning protein
MNKKDAAYTAKLKHTSPVDLMFGVSEKDVSTTPPDKNSTNTISIQDIRLPLTQPRRYFNPKKLEELSLSIKELGILEPLIVRPRSDGVYELIAGERRLKAAFLAGLENVPVIVKEMDDDTVKQVQLIENLQREDLNAYEETIGILELLALRLKLTQEEVISLLNRMEKAKRKQADNVIRYEDEELIEGIFTSLGRLSAESYRTNRLPLLNLPEDIKEALQNGLIEYTKARAIAKLKDNDKRASLLKVTIENNLSLVEIQQKIKNLQPQQKVGTNGLLKTQYKQLSKQLNSSKIWNNPKNQKRLEKLLVEIEALLSKS